MSGKPTKGGKRIQVLHDLINDDGYVALKWTAEDGEVWRYRGMISDSGRLLILMMLCIIIVTVSSVTFMNFTAISFSCLLMLSWTVATRRTWQCVTVPFRLSLPLQMEIFHLCETAVKSVGYHAIFGCCKSDCMSVHTYSRQNLTLVTLSMCGKPSLKRSVCVCVGVTLSVWCLLRDWLFSNWSSIIRSILVLSFCIIAPQRPRLNH